MKRYTLLSMALTISLMGCQKNTTSAPNMLPSPIPPMQNQEFKEATVHVDERTGVTITTEEVTDVALSKLRQEAQLTSLSPFPLTPNFNAHLFTIDQKEYSDFVFLAPKVYAFSTTDGARISILENEDGTVSIPFHVTMVSGLENKIPGPKTNELINVPETYLIRNTEELKSEALSRGRSKFAMLPGCPKAFSLKVVDREFDVTPKDLAVSDHCDLTKPFTLALRTSKSIAQYILQKALYDNTVDLRADYQTMVPYMVSKVEVEFNKRRIYDELEVQLQAGRRWLSSVDARYYLEKIMKSQVMSVDIRGDYTQQLEHAVDGAMRIFFSEIPEKQRAGIGCHGASVCLAINRDYRSFEQKVGFKYEHTANTLGSRIFRSTTRLQPLNDKSVVIGDSSASAADQVYHRPSLYNDGSSIETGLTVQEGDLLEISPSYLNVEQKELETAKVTRASNNVCIATKTETVCQSAPRACVLRNAPEVLALCPREQLCKDVTSCAKYQDQFIETTEYSTGESHMRKIDSPVGQFQEIYDGLVLKFTSASQNGNQTVGETVTCPLRFFHREGHGGSLTVRLENLPGCEIFKKDKQNQPLLHLVNGIHYPKKYRVGMDKVNWKGEFLQRHTVESFYPKVGFGGTLRIRGYRIEGQFLN